jgi:hypothetical protein
VASIGLWLGRTVRPGTPCRPIRPKLVVTPNAAVILIVSVGQQLTTERSSSVRVPRGRVNTVQARRRTIGHGVIEVVRDPRSATPTERRQQRTRPYDHAEPDQLAAALHKS